MTDRQWYSNLEKNGVSNNWLWILKCLSSSKNFPLNVQGMIDKVPKKEDSDKSSSWEHLLLKLMANDVTTVMDQLKIVPCFFTLPPLLRTRFLYLLLQHHSKVCHTAMSAFLHLLIPHIETNDNGNDIVDTWTQHLLKQLSSLVKKGQVCHDDTKQGEENPLPCYRFTHQAQLSEVMGIIHRKQHSLNSERTDCSPSNAVITEDNDIMKKRNLEDLSKNVVDVIIIDDDDVGEEAERVVKATEPLECEATRETKPAENNLRKRSRSLSGEMDTHYDQLNFSKRTKVIDGAADATSSSMRPNESFNNGDDEYRSAVMKTEEAMALPEDIKLQLASLRESLSSKDVSDPTVFTSLWAQIQSLKKDQIQHVCDFLHFQDLSEDILVTVCENLPWDSLTYESSKMFMQAFLKRRLLLLACPPSHTLIAALKSMGSLSVQMQILFEVLSDVLVETESALPLCQVLVSLCDERLTESSADFLMKQVCSSGVKMSENLTTVMQAVVDRRPDLSADCVDSMLRMCLACDSRCQSSTKMGKLLLTTANKYGKRLTDSQKNRLSQVVAEHTSGFKKALMAVLKKLSK